jgi:hypothetical protein
MSYTVTRSDPTQPTIIVPDGSVNISNTSLTLIGRNYPNYGQALADDFVHLLENFSSPNAPANPITGQAWYNSSAGKLNYFDGLQWNPVNVVYKSTATNVNYLTPALGDIVVVTDTAQLQIYNGTSWQIPANVDLTALSITTLTPETVASSTATMAVVDGGGLYNVTKADFLSDVYSNIVQTGMIMIWSMDTTPSGWLKCNGTPYPNAAYPALYTLIGTRYGTTGPTTFRVPNFTGPVSTGTATVVTNYIIKI